jgi:glycosyl transferase family 25
MICSAVIYDRSKLLMKEDDIMLLRCFDEVQVINLPFRKDRRREMEAQYSGFTFFPAIRPDTPEPFASVGFKGSYLSHLSLLKQARGSILILEDDCDLLDEAWTYELPADCDIFYGGYEASDSEHPENGGIVGAHCMGFSARAAKVAAQYLEKLLDLSYPPDPRASIEPGFVPSIRPPIDGAYVWFRRAHPELKTVFKQLAVQRPSRSDITPRHIYDRIWGLRRFVNVARSLTR